MILTINAVHDFPIAEPSMAKTSCPLLDKETIIGKIYGIKWASTSVHLLLSHLFAFLFDSLNLYPVPWNHPYIVERLDLLVLKHLS